MSIGTMHAASMVDRHVAACAVNTNAQQCYPTYLHTERWLCRPQLDQLRAATPTSAPSSLVPADHPRRGASARSSVDVSSCWTTAAWSNKHCDCIGATDLSISGAVGHAHEPTAIQHCLSRVRTRNALALRRSVRLQKRKLCLATAHLQLHLRVCWIQRAAH